MSLLRLSRGSRVALLVFGVILLCAVYALWPGPRPRTRPSEAKRLNRPRTVSDVTATQFVGSRACAGCHPGEFRDHAASNHALTLRLMRRESLPRDFPREGRFRDPDTGIEYALAERYGAFTLVARSPSGVQSSRQADLALGSGKRGMTFVSVDGSRAIRELRLSYLSSRRKWFITPAQEGRGADPIGLLHPGERAQRCLACHATGMAESRLVPSEASLGVHCEACHGPGKAHVAAARSGQAPGSIERLTAWGAARLNHLCGECHRSEREIDTQSESMTVQTQRFQPYGLMKSACFLKSGDRLSCVTCHNPHRNVETAAAGYERTCRSCHAPNHPEQKACPVNTQTGCVRCHMPNRELMPGIGMADHWIRVHPNLTGPGRVIGRG